MPGKEQLGNQQPGPSPDHDPAQGVGPFVEGAPETDLLDQYAAEVTAGDFDLTAEAQAHLADIDANVSQGGPAAEESPGVNPDGAPEESEDIGGGDPAAGTDGGPSRVMNALKSAGNAIREGGRWAAPVVGTALKEETGVDVYRFSGEQPELDHDQQFAAGVTRWAIRRGIEHLAERQASGA